MWMNQALNSMKVLHAGKLYSLRLLLIEVFQVQGHSALETLKKCMMVLV